MAGVQVLEPEIYLDMDGVLTDFITGMCGAHRRPNPYLDPNNLGKDDLAEVWGMSKSEFWRVADYHFWYNLPKTNIFHDVVAILKPYFRNSVTILSSPNANMGCIPGKEGWLRDRGLGQIPRFFGKEKWRLAAPSKLLIDDNVNNVMKFRERGGVAYLIPGPQNNAQPFDAADLMRAVTGFMHNEI